MGVTLTQAARLPRPAPTIGRGEAESLAVPLLSQRRSSRTGYGEIHGHHGEVIQGMFHATEGQREHGLVTLPCSLYSARAWFHPLRAASLSVQPPDRIKALTAARLTLDVLGRTGWGGPIRIESNVPFCWGCGSSTSDVVAVIQAVTDACEAKLEPAWLARLAVAAEIASDSLMYSPDRAVLFAQRRGSVLLDLGGPLPSVQVLGFKTETYHGTNTLGLAPCQYSSWEVEAFQPIVGLLRRAVDQQDPVLLGRAATASATINQRHRPKRFMPQLLNIANDTGAVGVQVAHSGSVVGFLYEPGRDVTVRMDRARTRISRLGLHKTWEFSTDFAARPESVS